MKTKIDLDAFIQNIQDMRDLRKRQQELLDELEYGVLVEAMWEARSSGPIGKHTFTVGLCSTSNPVKGHLVLKRGDGAYQKYPVRLKYMSHLSGDLYTGIVDIWDGGTIHPRLFEILLKKWTKRDGDHPLRTKRLKQETENGKPSPGPTSLEYAEHYPSGDPVRADDLLRDDGVPAMAD